MGGHLTRTREEPGHFNGGEGGAIHAFGGVSCNQGSWGGWGRGGAPLKKKCEAPQGIGGGV